MNYTQKTLKKHNISLSVYNVFISNCVIFGTGFITFDNFLNLPTTQYNVLVTIALAKFNKESTTSANDSENTSSNDSSNTNYINDSTTSSTPSISSTSSSTDSSCTSSTDSLPPSIVFLFSVKTTEKRKTMEGCYRIHKSRAPLTR